MKILLTLLYLMSFTSPTFAKNFSNLEISNIQSVSVEDGKIIITADAVLQSRMVTTEDNKDSKVVIYGQPSSSYIAKGRAVKIIVTPYKLDFNGGLPEGEKEKWLKVEQGSKKIWNDNLEAAKLIKLTKNAKITLQGEDVKLARGALVMVSGKGIIKTEAKPKDSFSSER